MELLIYFSLGLFSAFGLVLLRRRFAEFPGQTADEYTDGHPAFELKKCLQGKMICEGVIFGPLGRVTSRFAADFEITWEGDVGVMTEHFRYEDGSSQNREWTIRLAKNGNFTTTAPDVPGGGRGVQTGSAVQMRYRIRLPEAAGGHVLRSVDWMYLTPDGTIMNRSQFRKFGFRVAELIATIRPVPVAP